MNELRDMLGIVEFKLKSKKEQLDKISVNTFTYNPKITELSLEIKDLEKEKQNILSQMEDIK
jgi:hypothetical protein